MTFDLSDPKWALRQKEVVVISSFLKMREWVKTARQCFFGSLGLFVFLAGRVPPQTLLKMSGFALCFYLFIGISMALITIVSGQIFPFLYHVIKSIQNTYVLGRKVKLCFCALQLNTAFAMLLCFHVHVSGKIGSCSSCTLTHLLPWSMESLQTSGSFGIFGFDTFLGCLRHSSLLQASLGLKGH